MIDISKASSTSKSLSWKDSVADNVADYKEAPLQFYVRASLCGAEQADIAGVFGDITWLSRPGQPADEVAFVTDTMTEYELDEKLGTLGNKISVNSMIRVLDY